MLFKDTNMGTRPDFTPSDRLILGSILHSDDKVNREKTLLQLKAMNDTPTVFVSWDIDDWKERWFIRPYVRFARSLVRQPTDVVMVTHLILYFSTSVPSALFLYHHFTYLHAFLHLLMQGYYIGTYTLMMHQHIHMRGILSKKYAWFDHLFPYILDPLMGHTWNSYFYHHVKHHHVEGNGPHDLSSTIRYQRDSPLHFLIYVSRFFFLIWAELPVYFYRKGQYETLAKALVSEYGCFAFIICMAKFVNFRASLFVLLLPLLFIRLGLMVGNWGQHAFVDEEDPASDFRSSITLIDVASNRYCFNDGYHTSHHLNPLRHWRDHPQSFLAQQPRYEDERALVFADIDFLFITFKCLTQDYDFLARRLVPMGKLQREMGLEERKEMLRRKTRAFSEDEIRRAFELKAE